ncbi:hypothetical protein LCGC14_3094100, partial [marine sediment metagenome]
MVERVTGFAPTPNVREDTDPSSPVSLVSSPATCICDPYNSIFCDDAGRLTVLIRRGEKVANQYGDHLPLNLAVGDLADHLRVDRASV